MRTNKAMMKKILLLFLTVAMLSSVLFSCVKKDEGQTPDSTDSNKTGSLPGSSGTEGPVTDEGGYIVDEIPEVDFGGESVKILGYKVGSYEYDIALENVKGSVDAAVYKRNRSVEERVNVTLELMLTPGDFNNQSAYIAKIDELELNGESFDIYGIYSMNGPVLASKGYLADLLSEETNVIDIKKPWWNQSVFDHGTIYGKMYYATGDISMTFYESIFCLLYSVGLSADYQIENDPIEDVLAGKWTIDRMLEYTKDVYRDLDTDGEKSAGDIYGFVSPGTVNFDGFLTGSGLRVVDVDQETGGWTTGHAFTASGKEQLIDFNDKLMYNLLETNEWICGEANGYPALGAISVEERALFTATTTGGIGAGGLDFEYQVLPFPKLEETQDDYYSAVSFVTPVYAIPSSNTNKTCAATVLEALASESYRNVVDVFYERQLKSRYASEDPRNREMFDILRESAEFSIDRLLWNLLDEIDANLTGEFRAKIWRHTSIAPQMDAISLKLGIYLEETLNPMFRDLD